MFLEQLYHNLWIMVPILLVLAFRLNTKFENWENHNWWGGLIAALMAAMVFSI